MWALRAEALGILLLLAVSVLHPAGPSRWLGRGERALRRFAVHPILAPVSIGLAAIGFCAVDAAVFGMPLPGVHDEFSYLLAADTFAHGRLTNPAHPMWRYLEEFHVLQEPVRVSKYPPGMGLVLALGIVALGHPILGVWLVTGLACGATAWALRALLPPYWAWLGGLLLATDPIVHLWAMSYWGGSLSVLGGALAFGAFLRLRHATSVGQALIFGLGLVILAVARPFEGALLGATFVIVLLGSSLRPDTSPIGRALSRFWLPVGACLAVGAAMLGIYNAAITGSPWVMPYMLYTAHYDAAPFFLWQSLPVRPHYENAIFSGIGDWEHVQYMQAHTIGGFLGEAGDRLGRLFYLVIFPQNLLLIASLALPVTVATSRRARLLGWIVGVSLIGLLSVTYVQPHYAAPVLPVALGLLTLCLRRVNLVRFARRRAGQLLARGAIILTVAATPFTRDAFTEPTMGWVEQRQAVLEGLERLPGKHLVIVRYAAGHDARYDWVHNGADIDGTRVVWARDRDDGDEALIAYYRDRTVWLLEADRPDPKPVPFPGG